MLQVPESTKAVSVENMRNLPVIAVNCENPSKQRIVSRALNSDNDQTCGLKMDPANDPLCALSLQYTHHRETVVVPSTCIYFTTSCDNSTEGAVLGVQHFIPAKPV